MGNDRDKRAVALDLPARTAGTLPTPVAGADVVVDNRPETLDRLGLGRERLERRTADHHLYLGPRKPMGQSVLT
jgi:crotonobetainyl-CoA:carnitine CoA-transferase CaiB-like acyl-CoA transferase